MLSLSIPIAQADASPAFVTGVGDADCPHGGNYTSSACLLGVTAYMVESTIPQNVMYIDPQYFNIGAHINHTLWAYSGSSCNQNWVEHGYTLGFLGAPGYHWYSAVQSNGNFSAFDHGYTTANGSLQTVQIKYMGSQSWTVYRNGESYFGACCGTLGFGACIGQAGLEISRISTPPNQFVNSSTFNQNIAWYDTNYTFRGGWNASWIDYPCNLGQVPPNCLNGTFYGNNTWSDNKP